MFGEKYCFLSLNAEDGLKDKQPSLPTKEDLVQRSDFHRFGVKLQLHAGFFSEFFIDYPDIEK